MMQMTEEPRTRRWTRDEYYRMAEVGLFEGERVELIDGEAADQEIFVFVGNAQQAVPNASPHLIDFAAGLPKGL